MTSFPVDYRGSFYCPRGIAYKITSCMIKKERFVSHLANVDLRDEEQEFKKLFGEIPGGSLKEGVVIKGVIVAKDDRSVTVDVKLKSEGVVPLKEFELDKTAQVPSIGQVVDVFVEQFESRSGKISLSREKAIREEAWGPIEQAHKENRTVDGIIFGRIKGGLAVDLSGIVAFLPGSQIDTKPVKDITHLLNVVQPFAILKMDKKLGNVVVSRRTVLESMRSEAKEELLKNIRVGAVLEGIVKNITDYGVFVDLGSTDGLVHITDIAWHRVHHPSEVLKLGERVKGVVINFDPESRRISLGIKQLDETPWKEIQAEFPVGKVIKGKITTIADYGIFVELKNGIDGLVHVSQLSWDTQASKSFKNCFHIGQEVECKVVGIDQAKYRVSLSIKQCTEGARQKFLEEHPVGSVVKGRVKAVVGFGMFVHLTDDLVGLVHEHDLSWVENSRAALSRYSKGQEVECKILSVDSEKDRISLGIKQLNDDPYEAFVSRYKEGDLVECTVRGVSENSISVVAEGGISIAVSKFDLQSDQEVREGDKLSLKIASIDSASSKIRLIKG